MGANGGGVGGVAASVARRRWRGGVGGVAASVAWQRWWRAVGVGGGVGGVAAWAVSKLQWALGAMVAPRV